MKEFIKRFIIIAIGAAVITVGVNMFLAPHDIAAGGASGVGILIEAAFGIDRAVAVMVMNVFLLIICYFLLGKEALVRIAIGSIVFPIMLELVPRHMVTDDRMLSVFFGSALFGIGAAILFRVGASSGGTTIPPLIFKKYFGLSTSIGLLFSDATVVFFNIFVFGMESFLLAILSIVITSVVMSYIEMGTDRRIAVNIMSDEKTEEIKEALLNELNRGVTVIPVAGGYTSDEKEMLMMVLDKREYPAALKLINSIDKKSFVITYSVAEVHGLVSYQSA